MDYGKSLRISVAVTPTLRVKVIFYLYHEALSVKAYQVYESISTDKSSIGMH